MSTPDTTIDARLLESAKKHFLEKGFLGAQLKEICETAGITTGALYKRYKGKEELFDALVADTLADIHDNIFMRGSSDAESLTDEQLAAAWVNSYDGVLDWLGFCYERRDGFTLLVRSSAGTRHGNFLHEFCEKMTEIDYEWLACMQRRGLCRTDIGKRELHVLLTSYWEAYYEPFVHDFTWEELERHAQIMSRLFDWKAAFDIRMPGSDA